MYLVVNLLISLLHIIFFIKGLYFSGPSTDSIQPMSNLSVPLLFFCSLLLCCSSCALSKWNIYWAIVALLAQLLQCSPEMWEWRLKSLFQRLIKYLYKMDWLQPEREWETLSSIDVRPDDGAVTREVWLQHCSADLDFSVLHHTRKLWLLDFWLLERRHFILVQSGTNIPAKYFFLFLTNKYFMAKQYIQKMPTQPYK